MIYFIIGKEINGAVFLEGDSSGLYQTNKQYDFDDFPLASGMTKRQITEAEYQELSGSFDSDKKNYRKGVRNVGGLMNKDSILDELILDEKPIKHKQAYGKLRKKDIKITMEEPTDIDSIVLKEHIDIKAATNKKNRREIAKAKLKKMTSL